MKNIVRNITAALVSVICLGSCSQEFLDEVKPTTGVPVESIYESRTTAEGAMAGILRRFRGQFENAAGVASTDVGGLNSMFYARSLKGNDVISSNNWYGSDYENNNREPTYRRTTFTWDYPFFMINQVNNFIKQVKASTKIVEDDKNELLGQGYALRAFFYHQLVLEFSKSYNEDQNYPAPPIYKEPTVVPKGMSTVKEVYDFMVEDLTTAIPLLSEDRLGKSFVNKEVANAILAQVYQVMGKWDLAEAAAIEAYGGNVTSVLDAGGYGSGFKDNASVEWLWGSPQRPDQSNYYYLAPHAFSDHRSPGYYSAYVNSTFVSLFSATDVRGGVGPTKLFNKKSATLPSTDYRYYVSNKFSFTFSSHSPIIRYAEMILIDAEAKARQGNNGGAKTVLFALQKNRDANAVQSSNTGQALIDEILVERRKELFLENGIEWFDAKRLGKGMPRDGNQRLKGPNAGVTYDLQAHDLRFMLKVPQSEIDANPFIDNTVNNGK
ncbi:RagB/SusD family nutrient uptake outer membrane protein [Flavobacterium sp. LS1R47]|uniref:RagB/SusD family nutrient uptake outer membrane protein n=1 Tax=Flavobacterium frigoritolerans TaxID=2987686 RepID=A0A9X3C0M9_9FLAO|nr:RagB/SusD family nutrient uptake outer membrane protein [Flavobacterium frigoritolerans]MCV9931076.1 RagB/SusD family nutrient uptake outer membrane protein [Flavobacterium frigoritolerans]